MFDLATIVEGDFEDQKTPIVRGGPSIEKWCEQCDRTTRHRRIGQFIEECRCCLEWSEPD